MGAKRRGLGGLSLVKAPKPPNTPKVWRIPPSADGGQRRCLWNPPPFEKGGRKLCLRSVAADENFTFAAAQRALGMYENAISMNEITAEWGYFSGNCQKIQGFCAILPGKPEK